MAIETFPKVVDGKYVVRNEPGEFGRCTTKHLAFYSTENGSLLDTDFVIVCEGDIQYLRRSDGDYERLLDKSTDQVKILEYNDRSGIKGSDIEPSVRRLMALITEAEAVSVKPERRRLRRHQVEEAVTPKHLVIEEGDAVHSLYTDLVKVVRS